MQKIKSKNKFISGQSRYCQNCGKESHNLFEVTKKTQTIQQLQYCKECADKYEALPENIS